MPKTTVPFQKGFKMSNNSLCVAIRRALLVSSMAGATLGAGIADAQQANAPGSPPPQTLQTITVTGSHIRQAQLATAQPVITLTHDQILHQGFTSVADILQNLTVTGSPVISRSNALLAGEGVGGYYIDMHNMGASRTLVLLNGKRLGINELGLADLQQIPMSAIDRIEILKDGASAIYGSDAIAGVVNIITRNHFTGAEVAGYVGQYDENSDGTKQDYSMTIGANGDKGSVTLSAEYAKEDPVYAKDRWFSKYPQSPYHPEDGWSLGSQWGVFYNYDINTLDPYAMCGPPGAYDPTYGYENGVCTLNPGGDQFDLADYHPTNTDSHSSVDKSNPVTEMLLQTGTERKSLFVSGTYDFSERMHFHTDIVYNHRDTTQQAAGFPWSPGYTMPGSSTVIGLTPDSYFNPLGNGPKGNGAGNTLWFIRRTWEVPRVTQNEMTTYRIGGTLSGDFDIGEHNWRWDVGGYSNVNHILKTDHGNLSLSAASLALGPSWFNAASGRVECGTAANPIPYGSSPGSCVPWNPFYAAGQAGSGSLTGNPELQAYLFPYYHDTGRTQTTDYSANLTGSVFSLPAGDLAIATGVEYRREQGNFVPDAFKQGQLSTDNSSGPTGGGYTVKSEYLEVDVPLLKDLPGIQSLSLDAAIRHSKYSSFGSTTNAKLSLTWRPIEDLLVGGTIAHGFRAPQIADLFAGQAGTYPFYADPCDVSLLAGSNPAVAQRCTSGFAGQPPVPANFHQTTQGNAVCTAFPCQAPIQFLQGSNPLLDPEKALTRTAQIVYSPSWIPASFGRLDLSVDYFDFYLTNAITPDTTQDILTDCYVLGVASRCSNVLFKRDPANGAVIYALEGERNAGWRRSKGWDLGIHYVLPPTPVGLFGLTFNGTYWTAQNTKADNADTTPVVHNSGFTNGDGPNFRYRVNAKLDWTLGSWGATWTTRLYSSMKEPCSYDNTSAGGPECNMPGYVRNGVTLNVNRVGDTAFNDVQVRYTVAPIGATVSLGVNNVFDHFGGIMYTAPNSAYPYYGGFDIGRFYYVRYVQKF